jgi:hypothetical protein
VANAEELASQRIQSINKVLSIREGMLLQFFGCSGGVESDGSKSKDSSKRTHGDEKAECTSLLREVVDNMADFQADIDNTASPDDNRVRFLFVVKTIGAASTVEFSAHRMI